MPVICPAILASDKEQYHRQMEKVAGFAERIQIDLTDGDFAKNPTLKPEDAWWPVGIKADFHLMYRRPEKAINIVLEHKPNMIIVHAEADGHFVGFANRLHSLGIKIGVALLPSTPVNAISTAIGFIDHVLIFSGDLGNYGGRANLDLLRKANELKTAKPDIEIGWDGGINIQNVSQLASGGVDVFVVGGFLQDSPNPERDYRALTRIAEETGTT